MGWGAVGGKEYVEPPLKLLCGGGGGLFLRLCDCLKIVSLIYFIVSKINILTKFR